MTRVIATSAQGPRSPAFRVRIAILEPGLRAEGIQLSLQPLFDEPRWREFGAASPVRRGRALLGARRSLRWRLRRETAGTAFIQRYADMLPPLGLERLAVADRRVVLDVDDAIWIDGPASGGHLLGRLKRGEAKTRWLAERAACVLAGNELLADHLSRWAERVRVIPSLVDTDAVPARAHVDADVLTLGWIGSPTTAPYLQDIGAQLERFAAAVAPRKVQLLVVGGRAPDLRAVEVVAREWSETAERQALAEMDIGLMPLPDTPWTRGKCAYKALQYMAAGIPVVADDVGVTATVVGDAGAVAGRREDWFDALSSLSEGAALRARLGARGRARVAEDYSTRRWLPEIARELRGD